MSMTTFTILDIEKEKTCSWFNKSATKTIILDLLEDMIERDSIDNGKIGFTDNSTNLDLISIKKTLGPFKYFNELETF